MSLKQITQVMILGQGQYKENLTTHIVTNEPKPDIPDNTEPELAIPNSVVNPEQQTENVWFDKLVASPIPLRHSSLIRVPLTKLHDYVFPTVTLPPTHSSISCPNTLEANQQLTIGAAQLNDVLIYGRTNIRHGLGYTHHGKDQEAKKITFFKRITETCSDNLDNVLMSTKSVINDQMLKESRITETVDKVIKGESKINVLMSTKFVINDQMLKESGITETADKD
ncbi:hypothetical protein Fot_37536 [Forsythia ovata]|uniref:Uncharacterized protein n=1 Tax=Forsythia ovata TaxID=205694 RepID=A0ABD1S3D3_9LAMI